MAALNISNLDVDGLLVLRGKIDAKLGEKRKDLERQLAALGNGHVVGKTRMNGRKVHALKGRTLKAKYQSKKDPKLKWAGRGMMPLWMKEEMKAGKLNKTAFLIK